MVLSTLFVNAFWAFSSKKGMGHPRPLIRLLLNFSINFPEKTLDFSVIWARIVGVEGEHVDHSATTSAQLGRYEAL